MEQARQEAKIESDERERERESIMAKKEVEISISMSANLVQLTISFTEVAGLQILLLFQRVFQSVGQAYRPNLRNERNETV